MAETRASFPPPALASLAEQIATILGERKQTVSVVETAAGGLISAALLSVPGAAKYYAGGVTLYTLESRVVFGGWTEEDTHGYKGPTPEIVVGLAKHTRTKLLSTYAIGESGSAGPPKAVTNPISGTVSLAVSTPNGEVKKEIDTGVSERRENMVLFAEEALKLLFEVLTGVTEV